MVAPWQAVAIVFRGILGELFCMWGRGSFTFGVFSPTCGARRKNTKDGNTREGMETQDKGEQDKLRENTTREGNTRQGMGKQGK